MSRSPDGWGEDSGLPLEEELEEAFVLFQIKSAGDGFFPVMMDYNETPYYDLEEIALWMELSLECQREKFYCQGIVHPFDIVYWLDWKNKKMGDSRTGKTVELDKRAVTYKDDKIWIRWDTMGEWLDITTRWSLKHYKLSIIPHYKMIRERKAEREEQRVLSSIRQKELDKLNDITAKEPESQYGIVGRYALGSSRSSEGAYSSELSYELGSDIYKGFLHLSGSRSLITNEIAFDVDPVDDDSTVSGEVVDQEQEELLAGLSGDTLVFDYVNYTRIGHPLFYNLELGHTRFPSSTIIPGLGLSSGLLLQRKEHKLGLGRFDWRGKTEPEVEIELFINGFFQEVFKSDENGEFYIEERFVSGADTVTLKFYFDDGREDTQNIYIAGDSSLILDKGDYDYSFSHGETGIGQLTNLTFRYGLHFDNSAGLSMTQFPYRKVDDEGVEGRTSEMVLGFDYATRPHYGVSLLGSGVKHSEGGDFELRSYFTMLRNQTLSIYLQRYSEKSPMKYSIDKAPEGDEVFGLNYGVRYGKHVLDAFASRVDESSGLNTRYSYRHNRDFYVVYNGSFRQFSSSSNDSHEAFFSYTPDGFGDHEFVLTRKSIGWSGRVSGFNIKGWNDKKFSFPWIVTSKVKKSEGSESRWSLGGVIKFSERLASSVEFNNDGFSIRVNWRDGFGLFYDEEKAFKEAFEFDHMLYQHFASGSLEGYVLMPPESVNMEATEPLEGVEMETNTGRVFSDENGYYRMDGITPYIKTKFKVIENSLDASVGYGDAEQYYRFRPGTKMSYNPTLVWTAGIDGVVLVDSQVPLGTTIRVIEVSTGAVVTSGPVESDGFFMLEGLTPGDYLLELMVDDPPPPTPFTIEPGVDWLSDILVEWTSFESTDHDADDIDGEDDTEGEDITEGEDDAEVSSFSQTVVYDLGTQTKIQNSTFGQGLESGLKTSISNSIIPDDTKTDQIVTLNKVEEFATADVGSNNEAFVSTPDVPVESGSGVSVLDEAVHAPLAVGSNVNLDSAGEDGELNGGSNGESNGESNGQPLISPPTSPVPISPPTPTTAVLTSSTATLQVVASPEPVSPVPISPPASTVPAPATLAPTNNSDNNDDIEAKEEEGNELPPWVWFIVGVIGGLFGLRLGAVLVKNTVNRS